MARGKLGMLRLKAARVLYEQAEDGRVYGWSRLVELLVKNGINEGYAKQMIWDFNILGLLEKLRTGLYKVNKQRLKEYLDRYEAKLGLEDVVLELRGGSSGPAPSQEGA
jgi:hypothetical protein